MVDIIAEKENKGKRMKRTEDNLRDFWYNIRHTNIWVLGSQEEEEREKDSLSFSKEKKIWRHYSWKIPQRWKGNSQPSPKRAEGPLQDKLKSRNIEIHTDQINRNWTQKNNIKNCMGKARRNMQGKTYNYQQIFHVKLCRSEGNSMVY